MIRSDLHPPDFQTNDRSVPPSAGEFGMGAEFGGRQTESTLQFPHRRRGGYVLFPTIHKMHDFIKKEYTDNIEKVLRKVAR